MKSLKQIFCNHLFNLNIFKDYNSVGDESRGIESALISIKCRRCDKEYQIIDRQMKYIKWIRKESEAEGE